MVRYLPVLLFLGCHFTVRRGCFTPATQTDFPVILRIAFSTPRTNGISILRVRFDGIQVNRHSLNTKDRCSSKTDLLYQCLMVLLFLGLQFEEKGPDLRPVIELPAIHIYPNTATRVFFE
jgi:hypothetical protein